MHARFDLPRLVSEVDFLTLVADVVAAAPQLLWQESLDQNGHRPCPPDTWRGQCRFHRVAAAQDAQLIEERALAEPLQDTGLPAFRALCLQVGETHTRLVFQTTHALAEGGDVADVLRGRLSRHDTRPTQASTLSRAAHLGMWAIIPLLWVLNLGLARFETRERSAYGCVRLRLDRVEMRRAARRLRLSQRDLAFALATHHRQGLPGAKRSLFAAFSTLPAARVHLCDDEFLNVRMDEVRAVFDADFAVYANRLARALSARDRNAMFVQTWHRRLCQVHRWLHPRAPWLYPAQLFGFAPYDVVLSMLPPVRPNNAVPALVGAEIYAGSDTGTAESCIFAVSDTHVTITIWGGPDRYAHIKGIGLTANALGIEASRPD